MTDLVEDKLIDNESENGVQVVEQNEKPEEKTLTKTQLKKKKKLENIMKIRIEKRKKERESKKLKRILKKQNQEENGISNNSELVISRKTLKKNMMINSTNKLRIVVDCSFENLMQDNDISHLCKQLQFCYAANRRLKSPLQFYITDYKSKLKTMLDKMGGSYWDIHRSDESYFKLFSNEIEKSNVCYLTSDSPNELENFDEDKIYIIGGLVDHNHHKSLCYDNALKNNLQHYQLPISKYMNMKTRQVLTVNQVFEVICNFIECKDWKKAFIDTLPKRKGAKIKSNEEDEDDELKKDNNL